MVTQQQAATHNRFHYAPACAVHVGPRGGVTTRVEVWRANGALKMWKTRPGEFRLPIKYGLRGYSYLTHLNAADFHIAEECPHEELRG